MSVRYFQRVLAANEEAVIDAGGADFVQCTAGSADFSILIDGKNPVAMASGLGFRFLEKFNQLRIINGASGQTVGLYLGDGQVIDNRNVSSSVAPIRVQANQTTSYAAVSVGVAATLIAAANTSRGNIMVQNLGTGVVYLGTDASVTTANGIELAVGQVVTLTNDDAIYGISTIAATDVRYLEESV